MAVDDEQTRQKDAAQAGAGGNADADGSKGIASPVVSNPPSPNAARQTQAADRAVAPPPRRGLQALVIGGPAALAIVLATAAVFTVLRPPANTAGQAATVDLDTRRLALESRLRQRIVDLLTPVVGAGHVRAEVTVALDPTRSVRTDERFDPASQVARSSELREDRSAAPSERIPGVIEERTTFELSKSVETVERGAGDIERLSAAVLINDAAIAEGADAAARNEAIARLETLVRSAVGFDAGRGDTVSVVPAPAWSVAPEGDGWLAAPGGSGAMSLIWLGGAIAVGLLVGFALLLAGRMRRAGQPNDPGEATASPSAAIGPQPGESGPGGGALVSDTARPNATDKAARERIADLVTRNPDRAVQVMRTWLAEARP